MYIRYKQQSPHKKLEYFPKILKVHTGRPYVKGPKPSGYEILAALGLTVFRQFIVKGPYQPFSSKYSSRVMPRDMIS